MKHHNKNRKLGREKNGRHALVRSLARSLVRHERIETTAARAKELRPFIERLVTKGKEGTIAARRLVRARLDGDRETEKLFKTIAPRYQERNGGYTRILRTESKRGDGAETALIEFV